MTEPTDPPQRLSGDDAPEILREPDTPIEDAALSTSAETPSKAGAFARLVAAGILLSRVAGLIRERVFGHYFGTTIYADAFRMALRAPNALQNLLGEGVLSASFIPVYSELLAQGRKEEAGRVAGAIFALLVAAAGVMTLLGVGFAPVIVSIFSPGFTGERRELTIAAVRIIFPMTGVLVLSAWALGILNSHRRFFTSYVAPVLWNAAMITALLWFGPRSSQRELVTIVAWGALAGGILQFAVQLPTVLKLERHLKIRLTTRIAGVRTALKNAGPAVIGRGVVQVSGYLDLVLASFLGAGAVAALGYANTIYILPVSLFGMSMAAAELPELARQREAAKGALRERISSGLRRMAVLVVPSFVAFLALGDVLVAALYQTGDFERDSTLLVWAVLAAYAVGLLASTATRLYSSAFFALHDTKTPAKIAIMRVVVAAALGAGLMLLLRDVEIAGRTLGAAGLALGGGIAAWIEFMLLRRSLRVQLEGHVGAGGAVTVRLLAAAIIAAAAARGIDLLLPDLHPIVRAACVVLPYGAFYFLAASALGVSEARAIMRRIFSRFAR